MSRLSQITILKNHLRDRYDCLVEKSASYRFIDENISDYAAYKAMKIAKKLDQMDYLNVELR